MKVTIELSRTKIAAIVGIVVLVIGGLCYALITAQRSIANHVTVLPANTIVFTYDNGSLVTVIEWGSARVISVSCTTTLL